MPLNKPIPDSVIRFWEKQLKDQSLCHPVALGSAVFFVLVSLGLPGAQVQSSPLQTKDKHSECKDARDYAGCMRFHNSNGASSIKNNDASIKIRKSQTNCYAEEAMNAYYKDPQKSIDLANKALAIDPEDGLALNYRSRAKKKLGDLEGSLIDRKKYEQTASYFGVASKRQYYKGNYKEAIAILNKAIAHNANALDFYDRALAKKKLGDMKGYEADLQKSSDHLNESLKTGKAVGCHHL